MTRAVRISAIIAAALSTTACATGGGSFGPRPVFAVDRDIAEMQESFDSATSIKDYYAAGAETAERRNKFIAGRLTLYDLEYIRFISQFRLSRATEATAFDAIALGISSATTLFGGVRTKEILGAASTALAGGRSAYEKNFYDEQTAGALISQMNAERKTALIAILAGAKSSLQDYPLTSAIADLTAYQYAGTLEGALAGIQRDAGVKDAKATAILDQYRAISFAPDDSTAKIRGWLWPGMATTDRSGVVRDAAGNPIAVNAERLTALRAEIAKLGLDGIPIATFLTSGDLKARRAQVISNLQIP
jgi:hypothetical protein